jgi:hypothetical protein
MTLVERLRHRDRIVHPNSRETVDLVKEAATELEAKDKRIAELESGSCRFNCRTAKENWIDGYMEAINIEYSDLCQKRLRDEAEIRYNEWKRRQKTTT